MDDKNIVVGGFSSRPIITEQQGQNGNIVLRPPMRRPPCTCRTKEDKSIYCTLDTSLIPRRLEQINFVYTMMQEDKHHQCDRKADDKECKCIPPKPKAPCTTLDCECITLDVEAYSRKRHKSFCPVYKHKVTCPVTMMNDEEEAQEVVEDEVEPLPYGLPPLKFGACPVPGKPCSAPDGFTRSFKNTGTSALQPAYANVGNKISTSKEFDRIKKAMVDFMNEQKPPEFPCIKSFNVDTERRCCDKEQRLISLLGKSCCAEHKLASMALFKERAEREASERRNANLLPFS